MKSRMDVAQILKNLSNRVYSTTSSNILAFGSFILVLGISIIIQWQLAAMCKGHVRFVYMGNIPKFSGNHNQTKYVLNAVPAQKF